MCGNNRGTGRGRADQAISGRVCWGGGASSGALVNHSGPPPPPHPLTSETRFAGEVANLRLILGTQTLGHPQGPGRGGSPIPCTPTAGVERRLPQAQWSLRLLCSGSSQTCGQSPSAPAAGTPASRSSSPGAPCGMGGNGAGSAAHPMGVGDKREHTIWHDSETVLTKATTHGTPCPTHPQHGTHA